MLKHFVQKLHNTVLNPMKNYSEEIEKIVDYCLKNNLKLKDLLCTVEKKMIEKALELTNGNKLKASLILGISRKTLIDKYKKYNIDK